MQKIYSLIAVIIIISVISCSKKNHPSKTPEVTSTSIAEKRNDSLLAKNAIAKRKAKAVLPNVISVNDSAAHKSVDGRYYYDVMGHRYWRNNKDGKYYLFNKSMYNNPDFKKPG
jgi:hypothetical protein